MALTLTALEGIPLIKAGDDLGEIILAALLQTGIDLLDGDILVVTQKIVSKAEGRMVHLSEVSPSDRARDLASEANKDPRLVELILRESALILKWRPGTIIVEHRLGFVCANAGIDHSNVSGDGPIREDWVLLLPVDPEASARALQRRFEDARRCRMGVLIIDSHGRAWRMGTVGVVVGLSGVPGLVDLRGTPDLFDFNLRITQVAAGDELAAAASLVMGQAAEGTPVVHVRGFPYGLRASSCDELIRPKDQDMFR
jgi:coenzyme F420-0:L-glutamate ligase / coenzyme F420-1:gamma-L-glutamate ligase